MTVAVNSDRVAVEIMWDTELAKGDTVKIKCENPETGDVSLRGDEMANDGFATITFPEGYHGETVVTVTGSENGEDSGMVQV